MRPTELWKVLGKPYEKQNVDVCALLFMALRTDDKPSVILDTSQRGKKERSCDDFAHETELRRYRPFCRCSVRARDGNNCEEIADLLRGLLIKRLLQV